MINAAGKTLLARSLGYARPCQKGDNDGLLNLAAGVTTVRDLGKMTPICCWPAASALMEGKGDSGERALSSPAVWTGRGPFHGPSKVLVSH